MQQQQQQLHLTFSRGGARASIVHDVVVVFVAFGNFAQNTQIKFQFIEGHTQQSRAKEKVAIALHVF